MKNKWLIAALALAAAALVAVHLRMPRGMQTWRLEASSALARSGETMPFSMPQGEVEVNRASAEELTALEGVGPSLAQAIIAEREADGAFHYPEDLINVKGIGERTLERMREQLKLP